MTKGLVALAMLSVVGCGATHLTVGPLAAGVSSTLIEPVGVSVGIKNGDTTIAGVDLSISSASILALFNATVGQLIDDGH